MTQYTTENIRNIALIGHAGAGKTRLAEALLHKAGMIPAQGELARGTTVCDYDPQEKDIQHSVNAAVCHLDYEGHRINIIDTPGYPDLLGRAISVLPAVETGVLVINAQAGIELGSRRMMEAAKKAVEKKPVVAYKVGRSPVSSPNARAPEQFTQPATVGVHFSWG